ncbi:MAG: Hpt domain-containing protein [Bacteroidales bacterium]|jgi:HPt (histidine-containing phosphotransfer) domain-containing protein|nr:Hpt domain-containing protein [Bacteroidales bacterium]MDY0197543.1 Hpt domain-containing protein [Tenuifilaceae bacterium]
MQSYSHIDIAQINLISDGNKELISDLVLMFENQIPIFAKQLDELYASNDFLALGKLAHKIKGSVSIVGITLLANSMKKLEYIAKEGVSQEKYPMLIDEFKTISLKALNELKNYIENN